MAFTVDIRGNASHLEKTLGLAKSSLLDLGNVAKAGVAGLAALGAAGAAGLGAFVISSSKAAADIEDLAIQFEVLTGSVEKSKDLISQFREEEKKSALSTQDYAAAAKGLLANNVAYEDILPTLRMIGDVSMGNATRFDRVAYAMGQISSKTRLLGTETLQLQESGFNPLQQMMKMTGESYDSLLKKQEQGKISYQDVAAAMKFATSEGGLFYKAIEKGSASTSAKINQFGAAVTQLKVAFGTGFNDGLKIALDATNKYLPQLEGKFTEAGQIVGGAIAKAVEGDSSRLAAVGGYIGEVMLAGFKATFLKGMDELGVGIRQAIPTALNELYSGASLATGGSGEVRLSTSGAKADSFESRLATALTQLQNSPNLAAMRSANATDQSKDYAQSLIDKEKMQQATKEGVKEGMKEVWYSLDQGGARFGN